MDEKRAAKAAKREEGGEMGEEGGAVKVEMEAPEFYDDDMVFVNEIHPQHQIPKSSKEKRRERAANHQDTLTRRTSLNSKARRHIQRTLAATGREFDINAKTGSGGETRKEAAAVRVETEAMKDEDDDVVFGKEIHVQRKSRKERKREWAENHRDTLPERCSGLNSKARRHVRRMLAAAGGDLESR